MDGVDDDGDAGAGGGQAPNDAGFAAVGVYDGGGVGAEYAGEAGEGAEVMPRADGADEVREDAQESGFIFEQRFEGTFGAG